MTDWAQWLRRWDAQQEVYLPEREARFAAMLDVLADLLPPRFVALDVAAGPGAISRRLLARFPEARCVAVDLDPVLLTMGRAVLGDQGGRLRWVQADLEAPGWTEKLGTDAFDAVFSTTALHWLPPASLARLYQDLAGIVRPGGVFMNGDHLPFGPSLPTFDRLAKLADDRQYEPASRRHAEDWSGWWQALRAEPELADLLAERDRRFATHTFHDTDARRPILAFHVAALGNAGFREVGTIWQRRDDRALLAVR